MTTDGLDLQQVRAGIDQVDREIVRSLAARELLVRRAGQLKTEASEVPAPDRVAQVIARVRAAAAEAGASAEVVERTYWAMIAAFIDLELGEHHSRRAAATTDTR